MKTYEKLPEGFVEVPRGFYTQGDIVQPAFGPKYKDAAVNGVGAEIHPSLPCYRRAASPAPSPTPFTVGQVCQYRNGEPCRVLAVDSAFMYRGGNQPILSESLKTGETVHHSKEGRVWPNQEASYDLIPAPRKVKVDCWLNVYEHGATAHDSKQLADDNKAMLWERLACIHITREVAEGEGIE